MKRILVIGSVNIDLVSNMNDFPVPGEVVIAKDFCKLNGGKGANQSVGLGKLGAELYLLYY